MSGQSLKLSRGMTSTTWPARIAWMLMGLYAMLATARLILLFRPGMPQSPFYSGWQAALRSVALLVMAIMGALIVSRHPIGWLLTAVSPLLGPEENPFAINRTAYAGLQPFAAVTSNVLMPLFLLVGVLSLYLRFRRGDQVERQQIKWFVLGWWLFSGRHTLSCSVAWIGS